MRHILIAMIGFALGACANETGNEVAAQCDVSLIVLGVAQDAGKPQIGNPGDPAWADPSLRRLATSLALVDRRGEKIRRWLFEATPDIKEQVERLDALAAVEHSLAFDGVFLTHAHIGHYSGLMFFGHEAAGAKYIPVFAMPRMADFLSGNGPWSQLVKYENIYLAIMTAGEPESFTGDIKVTPFVVPHRDEFSETAGFRIEGPAKSAIFIPDIDSWEEWDEAGVKVEDMIAGADIAFLDATFFANGEIPGRDMSGFPHPFAVHSMERFDGLAPAEKAKVRFIHLNHTNPLNDPASKASKELKAAGFAAAEEGEIHCL